MHKILIDDSLRYSDGCPGKTYIEYADSTPEATKINNPETLLLELQFNPIAVPGYRLIEEKTLPNGESKIMQEFLVAPDVAYALFKHWEELDKDAREGG